MVTQQRLKELLEYDPNMGTFIWIVIRSGCGYRKEAGTIGGQGYILIRVDGIQYSASRLAWLYMTGEWPKDEVDHKDLNRTNNKWVNLRAATRIENNCNRRIPKNSTTGAKGVHKTPRGKFIARIQTNGAKINLGTYNTIEEASKAYEIKALEIQKEFMRLK